MKPTVTLIWRDTSGKTHAKDLPWRRPRTEQDLADYVEEYFDLLDNGYRPKGFDKPPFPHCARVTVAGRVAAEWYSRPKQRAGSLVGARLLLGAGLASREVVPVLPQEVKPNSCPSSARAAHPDSAGETTGAPGDTGRRSPAGIGTTHL